MLLIIVSRLYSWYYDDVPIPYLFLYIISYHLDSLEPLHKNLVLIAYTSCNVSDYPEHTDSLARAFTAYVHTARRKSNARDNIKSLATLDSYMCTLTYLICYSNQTLLVCVNSHHYTLY